MKAKPLAREQYQANMQPEERLVFGMESPFPSISLPKSAVFAAWHGSLLPPLAVGDARGTLYVCRSDNDPVLWNFDVYAIGGSESLEIQGPIHTEYHWTDHIPSYLWDQAPEWVRDKVTKLSGNRSVTP
ncbi:MAG: hypothetical protein G01um101438_64 [Parcubacteria group bacterium Gr01-1014_38]|nr:MAG: hypothetical protein G01um101438_64 [Parcubacteria group bacterium Gr01-1014_38]